MSEIVACYAVLNEAQQIAESLRSVKAYVDRYVIVDSAFTQYPGALTHSVDGTRQICERICAPLPLTYLESDRKIDQTEARNRYLDQLADGDWALVVDGDELVYGDHAAMVGLFEAIRSGDVRGSVRVPVYSTVVMFDGTAAEMCPDIYAHAPVYTTRGYQPRLLEIDRERGWRYAGRGSAMGLYDRGGTVAGEGLNDTDALFIVNHHTRQGYGDYLTDFVRETAQLAEAGA